MRNWSFGERSAYKIFTSPTPHIGLGGYHLSELHIFQTWHYLTLGLGLSTISFVKFWFEHLNTKVLCMQLRVHKGSILINSIVNFCLIHWCSRQTTANDTKLKKWDQEVINNNSIIYSLYCIRVMMRIGRLQVCDMNFMKICKIFLGGIVINSCLLPSLNNGNTDR